MDPSHIGAPRFRDRRDAGRQLAVCLSGYAGDPNLLVLGLPRGGVPVAYEIARHLGATLDVFVVRKLGVPGREELAFGALASGGTRVLNEDVVRIEGISPATIEAVADAEVRELMRREAEYRDGRPFPGLRDRTVILVDDGLATGATMRAAVEALRQAPSGSPGRLVVAVPVAAPVVCEEMHGHADEVVCLQTPRDLRGVGLWYEDFAQTSDDEVRQLLSERFRGQAGVDSSA